MERRRLSVFGIELPWIVGEHYTLAPEEVEYASNDPVLKDQLDFWEQEENGAATMTVFPWDGEKYIATLKLSEGLAQGAELFHSGYYPGELITVYKHPDGVEIVE